ncbi:geranylgeranyl reductase family protein [candidate division KSB3 bacterium]|uniref:Geranylgeranyl reductase family protein n=1 Tax=candidate division KSB3 bacterium TaxID=2044937 RepID=A0A9D5JS67_9BACT|nr:geranylgeranyl reductase family protein [candidate division KSB3 bacterium]MBD3323032.1 geranylgeranyl reductase family protein [candidate division KSB3 bacterium]
MTHYDTIIVGAGPAGSAAAAVLAAAGMHVLLLDKAVFPRDKLCAGGVSGRSRKLFSQIFAADWQPAVNYTTHGIAVYFRQDRLNAVRNYRPVYLTSRRQFDTYLLALAQQRGAQILQDAPVRSVNAAGRSVSLANGKTLTADFIIGTDGVLSRVAQSLGRRVLDRRRLTLGLEVEMPREALPRQVTLSEIYFGYVKWGYGWVFPKSETLTIGLGALWSATPHLKPIFIDFLQHLLGTVPDVPIRGHFLPFGTYRRPQGREAVLLAGDAAGFVEPITGEGIAFAMQSGQLAAQAILQAAARQAPTQAYRLYRRRLRPLISTFDYARILGYLVFPNCWQSLFVTTLRRTDLPIRKQMDLLADELPHKKLLWISLTKLGQHILNRLCNVNP